MNILAQLTEILKPLDDISTTLGNEKYITASLTLPLIEGFRVHLERNLAPERAQVLAAAAVRAVTAILLGCLQSRILDPASDNLILWLPTLLNPHPLQGTSICCF